MLFLVSCAFAASSSTLRLISPTGVDKEKVKLDVAEDSVEVETEDDKNFYKMINLDSPVNTDSSKASYKNGVLTLELEKKEKRTGKEIKIE